MADFNPDFERDAFMEECRTVYRLWRSAVHRSATNMPDSLQSGSPVSFEDEMSERIYVMLVGTWQALASYEPIDLVFSENGAHLYITRLDGKVTAQWESRSETLDLRGILINEAATCGLFDGPSVPLLADTIVWMLFDGRLMIRSWQRDPASTKARLVYVDKEHPLLTQ